MSQIKISGLPLYTGNTTGVYLVMNNSGETTTFKVTKETLIGSSGTSGTSGSNGSSGSSGSNGTNGSSGTSGSNGTNGTSGSNGTNGSSGTSGDSLFALTGSIWNTTNNVGITGSLNVSGSIDLKLGNITAGRGGGFRPTNTVFGAATLVSNSVGDYNTAFGYATLSSNTSGSNNTVFGFNSLAKNTTGNGNTAIGDRVLANNLTGYQNTGVGQWSLLNNTGNDNTAVGFYSMANNTTGAKNVSIGPYSLVQNTTGIENISIGYSSMYNNLIGSKNVAVGYFTSHYNVSGSNNIALGHTALLYNISGSNNVAIGQNAGREEKGDSNFYLYSSNAIVYPSINQERSGSLMWGTFSTSSVLQTLQINASTDIRNNLRVTGSLNITGSLFLTGSFLGSVLPLTITSTTASLNLNSATIFTLQLIPGTITHILPTNIRAGETVNLLISTTGSAQVTFPTTVKQPSGSSYIPTTTTGKDILSMATFDNTNVYLTSIKNLI